MHAYKSRDASPKQLRYITGLERRKGVVRERFLNGRRLDRFIASEVIRELKKLPDSSEYENLRTFMGRCSESGGSYLRTFMSTAPNVTLQALCDDQMWWLGATTMQEERDFFTADQFTKHCEQKPYAGKTKERDNAMARCYQLTVAPEHGGPDNYACALAEIKEGLPAEECCQANPETHKSPTEYRTTFVQKDMEEIVAFQLKKQEYAMEFCKPLDPKLPNKVVEWQQKHFGWLGLATMVPPGILQRKGFKLYAEKELRNRIRARTDRRGKVLLQRNLTGDEIDFLVWLYDRFLRISWKQYYDIRAEVRAEIEQEEAALAAPAASAVVVKQESL